jgi:pyridoxamine 5'-phosphate oxidase family protein
MALTDAEINYLETQQLGRLATIQSDGSPQVKPVGFRYNPGLGTIDVTGFNIRPGSSASASRSLHANRI